MEGLVSYRNRWVGVAGPRRVYTQPIAVLTHRYLQNPFHGGDYYDARYNKRNQVVPLIVEALGGIGRR